MKSVTSGFKTAITSAGKQLDAKVIVGSTTYQGSDIVSINPHYDGALLRSVMKCVDIELDNVPSLASTTIDNVQFGLLVGSAYEYVSFGKCKYRKEDAAYSEETNSLSIKAYDLMLDSMVPYDLTGITYPCTVAAYLQAICTRLGWPLGTTGAFVNSTVQIEEEKYDNSYTFRDVLDDIAEVAAGTIAFKSDNKLYILYPTETGETIDCNNLSSLKIGKKFGPVNSIVIARTPQEDNIYAQDAASVLANGLTEIRIENNQIMDSHREDFTVAILAQLNGLTYYFYELESFGIAYMELCDRFTLEQQDGTTYSTLFLRDDLEITQGIHEASLLEETEANTATDYKAASTTDRALNQTILKVNKQTQEITALVQKTTAMQQSVDANTQAAAELIQKVESSITSTQAKLLISETLNNGVDKVAINTTEFKFDKDGLLIDKNDSDTKTQLDEAGMEVTDKTGSVNNRLFYAGVEDGRPKVETEFVEVKKYIKIGNNSRIQDYGTDRTGIFFVG